MMNYIAERIKRIPFVVIWYKLIYPIYSTCGICGLPWKVCKSKSVMFNDFEGPFATCQFCWDRISLQQALQAYREMYKKQCNSLDSEDRKRFMRRRPLSVVLEYVRDEYNKTHKK